MAVRPIVIWPDPRLREATRPIAEVTDEIRALYRDLCDTMYAYNGVGIAAIQIGVPLQHVPGRAAVAGREAAATGRLHQPGGRVGPSSEKREGRGGLPVVPRHLRRRSSGRCVARVRAMGIDGEMFEAEGEGLFARAMLHENDHLTGKLLVDFVGPLKKRHDQEEARAQGKAVATCTASTATTTTTRRTITRPLPPGAC